MPNESREVTVLTPSEDRSLLLARYNAGQEERPPATAGVLIVVVASTER